MSDTNTNTTIDQKNISPDELDNLLGMPGADSVTIPAEEEKPSFFTKDEVDVSFLNEPIENTSNDVIENNLEKTTEEVLKPEVNNVEESKNENFDDLVAQVDDVLNEEDDSNVGRPKLDKEGMAQLTKELIKEGLVVPFSVSNVYCFTSSAFDKYLNKPFKSSPPLNT